MVYHSLKWTIFSYILTVLTSRFSICLIPTEPVFHCVLADCKLQLVIIWFVHKLKVFGVENSCRISFPSFNINPWCSEVTWNDTHVVSDLCKCLSWFEMNFHNVWKEGWTPEVTSWNFWNCEFHEAVEAKLSLIKLGGFSKRQSLYWLTGRRAASLNPPLA